MVQTIQRGYQNFSYVKKKKKHPTTQQINHNADRKMHHLRCVSTNKIEIEIHMIVSSDTHQYAK